MNKVLKRQLNKWVNSIPWLPEDIVVTVEKGAFSITPKDRAKGAKYDRDIFDKIHDMVWGAQWFTEWVKERKKK